MTIPDSLHEHYFAYLKGYLDGRQITKLTSKSDLRFAIKFNEYARINLLCSVDEEVLDEWTDEFIAAYNNSDI